jgi:hypothetical protein
VSRVVAIGRFLWDFVVGDDPWIAGCVTVALLVTLGLSHHGVSAWWLLPLVVAAVLWLSVARVAAARRAQR